MKPALRLHLAFAGLGVTAAAFPAILPTAVVAHGDAALAAPGTLFAGLLVGVLLSGLLARSGRLARTLALGAALQAAGLLAATTAATAGLFVAAAAISGVGFGITEAAGSASARTVSRNAAHALTGLTTSVAAAAALAPLLVLGGAQVGATGAVLVVFATVNAAACVAAATAGRAFDEQPARRGTATHARFGAAWVGFAIALALYVGIESLLAGWSSAIPFALLSADPAWAALGTSAFWACMALGRAGALTAARRGASSRDILTVAGAGSAAMLVIAALTAAAYPVLSVSAVAATVVLLAPTYGQVLGLALERTGAARAVAVTGSLVACGAAGGALVPLAVLATGSVPGDPSTFVIGAVLCAGWLAAVLVALRVPDRARRA